MSDAARRRAIRTYRARLGSRGLARFEVIGAGADRDLIRSLARRLAEADPEAARIRATIRSAIADAPTPKGGILAALRRSPLVGAKLKITRSKGTGRKIDL